MRARERGTEYVLFNLHVPVQRVFPRATLPGKGKKLIADVHDRAGLEGLQKFPLVFFRDLFREGVRERHVIDENPRALWDCDAALQVVNIASHDDKANTMGH